MNGTQTESAITPAMMPPPNPDLEPHRHGDATGETQAPEDDTRRKRQPRGKKGALGILAITSASSREITARRFGQARKLSGYDQRQAAEKLGYANSSPLSKIEAGDASIPLYMIQRAAVLYGVSADYMLGLSDYPERDNATIEQMAVIRWMRAQIAEGTMETVRRLQTQMRDAIPVSAHLAQQTELIGEVWKAFCAFSKDGNRELLREAMDRLVDSADGAQAYLKRRQSMKAAEYLADVERDYPLLAPLEGGRAALVDQHAMPAEEQMEFEL